MLRVYVSSCLWPVMLDRLRTGWLGFNKASLRLLIGLITVFGEIITLTKIWSILLPDYCKLCCDKKELKTSEHLLVG